MPLPWKAKLIAGVVFVPLIGMASLAGAQVKPVPAAPIPTQILNGKKVFIANGGGDERSREQVFFSGGVDRPYNQFYAAMKSAGRYELVGSPAEADLLFEIRFLLPTAEPAAASHETTLATVAFDPQFRLEIRDPKANALLWGFTEHVSWAMLQSNRDKNFDQAAARVALDIESLVSRSNTADRAAQP